jgi:prevent-host-death family protein
MKVSVAEAKNRLPTLIKAVEDGESVTIYRHGRPVVDIAMSLGVEKVMMIGA